MKIHKLLFSLLLSLWVIACSSDDSQVTPDLIVAKDKMSFGKNTGTQKLAIKTNVRWEVKSSETWCTLSSLSGDAGTVQIEVTVTANPDTDPRKATITVTAGGIEKEVAVEQSASDFLELEKDAYPVSYEGGEITVAYQTSAEPQITINDSWISEATSRAISAGSKTFTIEANTGSVSREGTITLAVGDLKETVTITQAAQEISIPADRTGMESNAKALAAKIKLGWNLGNSLEATSTTSASETLWGNPATTQAMINMVKEAGFNAVRIPCAWNAYIEDQGSYKISESWMNRVKEVVDYCVGRDMYAIINIHWDGGWLEENAIPEKQDEVNIKQRALWQQIALAFRDYGEHLLFAGTNEVHSKDSEVKYYDVQMSYNQTFVDAVRATGGRNTYRNLIVQAFSTDIDEAYNHMVMSTDPTPDRLMLEVHYYSPWNFCGMENDESWGKVFYLWGAGYKAYANSVPELNGRAADWGEEDYLLAQFGKMKEKFVDNGYPIILGEYGSIRHTTLSGDALKYHLESRAFYHKMVTREAKNYGLVPFFWDNGNLGDKGFGIFDRNALTVSDTQLLNALVEGANEGVYPY